MSLLDDAKNVVTGKRKVFTKEDEELVAAWINGEVTLEQLKRVKKFVAGNQAYNYIAFVCRQMLSENGNRKGKK